MPVSTDQPMASREEIVRSLDEKAAAFWGRERAETVRPLIEETAGRIWRISQHPPPGDQEPGFYLQTASGD